MRVISLSREKKHFNKLILSDGSELLLDSDVCSEKGIASGYELDGASIKALVYESEYRRARSRAMWYLDRTDYTEKALYEKLLRAGFKADISAEVMARLCELGLVNDRRYAERLAERCAQSNISERETVRKMLLKGVPLAVAKEAVSCIETDEEAQLAELISRKYARKLSEKNGMQRVYAALVRKGFSFGAVRAALKKYDCEIEYSEEN